MIFRTKQKPSRHGHPALLRHWVHWTWRRHSGVFSDSTLQFTGNWIQHSEARGWFMLDFSNNRQHLCDSPHYLEVCLNFPCQQDMTHLECGCNERLALMIFVLNDQLRLLDSYHRFHPFLGFSHILGSPIEQQWGWAFFDQGVRVGRTSDQGSTYALATPPPPPLMRHH